MNRRGASWTPVFDYLTATLGLFLILALVSRPEATPPRIETLGVIAVTDTWKTGSDDDVDLYVRDPKGRIVYFANPDAGLMHLDYDDLGTRASGRENGRVVVAENSERILIRAAEPGEYTANVHMYLKSDPGMQHVTVRLWRLRGDDRVLVTKKVVLVRNGDEVTAFRFTLNAAGEVSHINTLPRRFVNFS